MPSGEEWLRRVKMNLAFESETVQGVPLLAFRGELDGVFIDEFEQAVIETAQAADNCVIVDLGGVTYIDSQSFGRLLKVHVVLERDGGDIAIVAAASNVARIIKTFGADYLLAVFEDRNAAADYLLPLLGVNG
jgi:anti-anti-sigma factor